MSDALAFLKEEINNLKKNGLLRKPLIFRGEESKKLHIKQGNGKELINFCSNDYLGFCSRLDINEAQISATRKWGSGAGASRLVSGTREIHRLLEEKLAEFEKKESAIVFSSGYMANVGTISALVGVGDAVVLDRLDHASIVDGARLSGAKLCVFPHRDVERLEWVLKRLHNKRRRLIVTDGIFSMDGDLAPLREIVFLKKKYNAILMVDEAHGTGVFGENGSGISEALDVKSDVDVLMGTLSKAVGVLGGFVAGSKLLTDYLLNKGRSYIYTTALPPNLCGAIIKALELIREEPESRKRLLKNAEWLRSEIRKMGMNILDSESQIIPIVIGDHEKTLECSKKLMENGIFVQAIRPPTVPKGSGRLRVTVSAFHEQEDLEYLLTELRNCIH